MTDEEKKVVSNDVLELEVTCRAQGKLLSTIRHFCLCVAQNAGFNSDECGEIEMAVDEACANVIRHAYKHLGVSTDIPDQQAEGEDSLLSVCTLKLRACVEPHRLVLSIIDNGIGMYRMPPGVTSVEEYQERGGSGGLGLFIIRQYMDEVEYHYPSDAGTVVTMVKYLRPSCKRAVQ